MGLGPYCAALGSPVRVLEYGFLPRQINLPRCFDDPRMRLYGICRDVINALLVVAGAVVLFLVIASLMK